MEYKISKFNLVSQYGEKTLIFNSLNNTFSSFTNYSEDLLSDINKLNEDQIEIMEKQGIIVDSSSNEDKLAYMKYISIINSEVLHLILMPTMSCNFRCTYCYEDKVPGKMSDDVVDSIILCVQKNIMNVRAVNISWFGGEPLLCMDIIEKVSKKVSKIAQFYRKNFFGDITTNGYYLTIDNFYKLQKCNVTNYQVTIDGNEQNHNKTRPLVNGGESYQTIIQNLKNIRDMIKTRLFSITIRVNLTKETMEEFDTFMGELCKEFGSDNRFLFLLRRVGNWGGESVKGILDHLITDEDILIQKLFDYQGQIRISKQFAHFEKFPFCYAACDKNYVFNPKGEVLKCTVDLENQRNKIGHLDKLGNMNLNSNRAKWLYCLSDHSLEEYCSNCKLYANCFANICPLTIVNEGDFKSSRCSNLEKQIQVYYKMRPEKFLEITL